MALDSVAIYKGEQGSLNSAYQGCVVVGLLLRFLPLGWVSAVLFYVFEPVAFGEMAGHIP